MRAAILAAWFIILLISCPLPLSIPPTPCAVNALEKVGEAAPPLSPLPLGACSVRERPHMQQADAVRPDHIHHKQDKDRGRNQRKKQTALLMRQVHEIQQDQSGAADRQEEE